VRILFFVAALGGILSTAVGADQYVRAEVQHVVATPQNSEDPEMAMYKTKFDLRLTNRTGEPMNIPRWEKEESENTRIFVLAVQSKQQNGIWKNVNQSSWYGDDTTKFVLCTSLPPSGTTEIGGVASGLSLLRKQLADLGSEPTIRLNLMFFCKQSDGKVVTSTVKTEPFSLRLPIQTK
jgi:hypothetical protein